MTTVAPFALPRWRSALLPGAISNWLTRLGERALAFPTLNSIYAQTNAPHDGHSFCERVLHALRITVHVADADMRRIPRSGGVVIVANHPFGGLDGIVLAALLGRVRADTRVLANFLLARIPEMRESCLFVDPFGGPQAAERSRSAMRAAVRWVRDGGALVVFPAGEVSHLSLARRDISDPAWSQSVARLIRAARCAVVPIYFEGRNRAVFQLAGLIHPRLRTVLLPHELLAKRGRCIHLRVGLPIQHPRLERFFAGGDADAASKLTDYLRLRTYILSGRSGDGASNRRLPNVELHQSPIVAPIPSDVLDYEIRQLPASQRLVGSGDLSVYYGSAAQLPKTLLEIGRLREETFRLVGEGTGKEIDLDRFDQHYLHLFAWDQGERRIVGAYRLGRTDELLARFGPRGLYTSTLFDFHPRLFEQISPALEMGRSFVVPEHQRDFAPLMLLWKGIGRFVTAHPRYRRIFGAVSISDEFQSMTKQLLVSFLTAHNFNHELAALARPRRPLRRRSVVGVDQRRLATLVSDVADVEELVRDLEDDRRTMPVLLRQYLRLNARLLGFNIDPDFGDVLDGLILIDLPQIARPILDRYFGRDGAAAFLALHAR
ncbi:MAG: GNAT family N-acyltransferase [Phycisphaerae bacterium]